MPEQAVVAGVAQGRRGAAAQVRVGVGYVEGHPHAQRSAAVAALVRLQRREEPATVGGQRGRRRGEAGDPRGLAACETGERRRVARGHPHVAAERGDRRSGAAHLLGEQHRRARGIDQGDGRVERVRDPHPARARDDRAGSGADRDLLAHLAAPRIQPGDAAGARDAHPDRPEAGGKPAGRPAQRGGPELPARAGIDSADRRLARVGDPDDVVRGGELDRAGADRDPLHDTVRVGVDAHHNVIAGRRHPDVAGRGDDADGPAAHSHRLRHVAVAAEPQQRPVVGRRGPARPQAGGDARGGRGQRRRRARPRVAGVEGNQGGRAVDGGEHVRSVVAAREQPDDACARQRRDGGEGPAAAPRRGPRRRLRRRRGRRRLQRRVLAQDALLQLAQAGARLEPQFVDEVAPDRRVVLERVGLRAGPVQRQHQQLVQALPPGMVGGLPPQHREHLGDAAEVELHLRPLLHRRQPRLGQRGSVGPQRRQLRQAVQRRSAPQRQRLAKPRGGRPRIARLAPGRHQRVERVAVDARAVEGEPVAGRRRLDRRVLEPRLAQRPAQAGDVGLDRLPRARGRVVRPQRVDERVTADELPGPQDQERQHDSQLHSSAQPHLPGRTARRQRTQHAEFRHLLATLERRASATQGACKRPRRRSGHVTHTSPPHRRARVRGLRRRGQAVHHAGPRAGGPQRRPPGRAHRVPPLPRRRAHARRHLHRPHQRHR